MRPFGFCIADIIYRYGVAVRLGRAGQNDSFIANWIWRIELPNSRLESTPA
jgi:hypothetical protein